MVMREVNLSGHFVEKTRPWGGLSLNMETGSLVPKRKIRLVKVKVDRGQR